MIRWKDKLWLVHRATYVCERGPIPEGMKVLHSCDVRLCRNINHLRPGTSLDNAIDRDVRGRTACGPRKDWTRLT